MSECAGGGDEEGVDGSCLALREMQQTTNIRIEVLLTTVTRESDRISRHGVRRIMLEQPTTSLGLPLHQDFISKGAGDDEYESKLGRAFSGYRDGGIPSLHSAPLHGLPARRLPSEANNGCAAHKFEPRSLCVGAPK